ncbi:MAG: hypothetical protein HY393_04235 [Candidatus Diapherotrites archaeon]|nr:hypothetical protein [Candidatus Diapherotrites archaeon]
MKKHKKARARSAHKRPHATKGSSMNAHRRAKVKPSKPLPPPKLSVKKKHGKSFLSALLPKPRASRGLEHAPIKKKPLRLHFPSFLLHPKKTHGHGKALQPPAVPLRNFPSAPKREGPSGKTVKTGPAVWHEQNVSKSSGAGAIVTVYDNVLDLVRQKNGIALNELAKRVKLKEDKLVEELQTLEDNGLLEVRYPPLGEPRVYVKEKSEA